VNDHGSPEDDRVGSDRERQRAKKDVWSRTLSQIPTTFGDEEADAVLRQSHEEAFSEWLNFPLEAQRRDLEEYLESVEDDKSSVLRTWLTLAPYRNLGPAAAGPAERELYISDLELILELLRNEFSPSS
jgi:hypothetical protein